MEIIPSRPKLWIIPCPKMNNDLRYVIYFIISLIGQADKRVNVGFVTIVNSSTNLVMFIGEGDYLSRQPGWSPFVCPKMKGMDQIGKQIDFIPRSEGSTETLQASIPEKEPGKSD